MDREEQKQITEFINGAVTPAKRAGESSFDVEADAIIRALFVRNPEAAYRVTKLAISQSQEIERLRAALAEFARLRQAGWLTRLFKSLQIGSAGPAE